MRIALSLSLPCLRARKRSARSPTPIAAYHTRSPALAFHALPARARVLQPLMLLRRLLRPQSLLTEPIFRGIAHHRPSCALISRPQHRSLSGLPCSGNQMVPASHSIPKDKSVVKEAVFMPASDEPASVVDVLQAAFAGDLNSATGDPGG